MIHRAGLGFTALLARRTALRYAASSAATAPAVPLARSDDKETAPESLKHRLRALVPAARGAATRSEAEGRPPLHLLYADLSKFRLGALVLTTTVTGFLLAPGPVVLSTLASTTAGTALCIASANSANHCIEVESDALMERTKRRPLPAGHLSRLHGMAFSAATGVAGVAALATLVGPGVAALGAHPVYRFRVLL